MGGGVSSTDVTYFADSDFIRSLFAELIEEDSRLAKRHALPLFNSRVREQDESRVCEVYFNIPKRNLLGIYLFKKNKMTM